MPILLWRRLSLPCAAAATLAAGVLLGTVDRVRAAEDCRTRIPDGAEFTVRGTFEAIPGPGGAAPFLIESGAPGGCRGRVRAVIRGAVQARAPQPGDKVAARGQWVRTDRMERGPQRPMDAGYLALDSLRTLVPAGPAHRPLLAARGAAQRRLRTLLGQQAPVAEALVLARREALDPELRERFARAGVAHLLAISGFHVGVVAAALLALAALARLDRRRRTIAAVLGTWTYVAAIGAPYAAVRAAAMFTLALAGRLAGRPTDPLGALAGAAVTMLLVAPGAILDVGFQLSFAGAAGLVILRAPLASAFRTLLPQHADPGRRVAPLFARVAKGLADGLAVGLAATLATAPLTALHFGRLSLVGIPLTLLLAPLLCLAIPQLFLVLAVSLVHAGAAGFLAGGLGLVLAAFTRATEAAAALPAAALAVPRYWLLAAAAGAALALAATAYAPPLRRRARYTVAAALAVAAILLAPLAPGAGAGGDLRLYFLDVGQGDAIAVRSPAGRWVLVDAGPRGERYDAGARVVVPFLRRQGVGRLEALFLTHPDLDHMGGAPAVLDALRVGAVIEPGRPTGKPVYLEILERVDRRAIRWVEGRSGRAITLDGVRIEVLHPPPGPLDPAREANDYSLVLRLSYGRFTALLTGDAPAEAEVAAIHGVPEPRTTVLKVAHHGSTTSTSPALLRAVRPDLAVVSVGRRNRYGHPAPAVLARLERAGARIFRTDLHGTVRVDAHPDGSFRVRTARPSPRPRPREQRQKAAVPGPPQPPFPQWP